MKRFFYACGLVALSAVGAQADTGYSCVFKMADMAPAGKYDLIIVVDGKTGKAEALNAFAKNDDRHKTSPPITIKRGSDGAMIFSWTDEDVRFNSYSSDLAWRVVIEANGAVDATISPISYPPSLHYKGTCEIEQGKFKIS